MHRDLKPENIFLDENNRVKLGDFGVSKDVSDQLKDVMPQTKCGTLDYMAPEIHMDEDYGVNTDIWGLGVILYEMAELKRPINTDVPPTRLAKILLKGEYKPPGDHNSQALKDLIKQLLVVDYEKRPSID